MTKKSHHGDKISQLVVTWLERAKRTPKFVMDFMPLYGSSSHEDFHNLFTRGRDPSNIPIEDLIAFISLFRDKSLIPSMSCCTAYEVIELFGLIPLTEIERQRFFVEILPLFSFKELESAYEDVFGLAFPYWSNGEIPLTKQPDFDQEEIQFLLKLTSKLSLMDALRTNIPLPNLKIEAETEQYNLRRSLLNGVKKITNREIISKNEWIFETRQIFLILTIIKLEKAHILLAKCMFLLYLLSFLEAAYSFDPKILKRNESLYKRLLFYFLDIFPSENNKRGNFKIVPFLKTQVFELTKNKWLELEFDKWYGVVKQMETSIMLDYSIDNMRSFTPGGIYLSIELIKHLIKNVEVSDLALSLDLARYTKEDFNADVVRMLQDRLYLAIRNLGENLD